MNDHNGSSNILPQNRTVVFGLFFLLSILFYMDRFLLGDHSIITIHDVFDQTYPIQSIYGDLLKNHGLFYWFPNIAGGLPSYASLFPPYHPLVLISNYLPMWAIDTIVVIGLMTTAGYGMYRFLADYFNLDSDISIIGGVLFALSTQVSTETTIHFFFLFPMFFVWTMLRDEKENRYSRFCTTLGVLFILLLCHPAHSIQYLLPLQLLLIWFLTQNSTTRIKQTYVCIVVWLAHIILWSPVLYTLLEFVPFAHRESVVESVIISETVVDFFSHLIFSLFSDRMHFPITTGTLVIAIASLMFWSSCKDLRRSIVCLGLYFVISAVTNSAVRHYYAETFIAELHLGHLERTLHYFLIIVACLFVRALSNKTTNQNYLIPVLGSTFLLLITLFGFQKISLNLFLLNLTTSFGILFFSFQSRRRTDLVTQSALTGAKAPALVILACTCMFLLAEFKLERTIFGWERQPYKRYFENHSILADIAKSNGSRAFRVGSLGVSARGTSTAQSYGLETPDSRYNLFFKRYKEYFKLVIASQLKSEVDERFFDEYDYQLFLTDNDENSRTNDVKLNIPLLLAINTKYLMGREWINDIAVISSEILFSEADSSKSTNLWVFNLQKLFKTFPTFRNVYDQVYSRPIYLYKLDNSFERGYLVNDYLAFPSDGELLEALSNASIADLSQSVFVSLDDRFSVEHEIEPNGSNVVSGEPTLTLRKYSPDYIEYEVKTNSPKFLIVSNNYHPNWSATVNGQPVEIFRANYAFQGIIINNVGKSVVKLSYQDRELFFLHFFAVLGVPLIFFGARIGRTRNHL